MKTKVQIFLLGLIVLFIYRAWFGLFPLTAGDWHYLFPYSLSSSSIGWLAWDFSFNNGLGGNDIFLLGLNSYFVDGSAFLLSMISWPLIERIMWFWPYLLLSFLSSWYFYKAFFPKSNFLFFSILLFLGNTYNLMIIGGGQTGIGMAISLTPLALGLSIKSLNELISSDKKLISLTPILLMTVLAVALQTIFDLRIVYISLVALFLYCCFSVRTILSVRTLYFLGVGVGVVLLNAFWIFPQAMLHSDLYANLGSAYNSLGSVQFFSFAKFENAFGLLQPNWPQNIFGKTYFMRSEFLILPLLAYSSLFFINKSNSSERKYILYFATLGLLGVFLAKGANDPFGGIYLWLFTHFPGFIMFRDPTKWYLLVVISYMVLIPYTIEKIYLWLKMKYEK